MPKMREKEDHHVGSLHGRDLLLCFIMVIMDMLVSSNDLLNTGDKQTIYTVSVLVIAGAVSEWLGVWMDGADSALRILHILVETIELSSAPISTVLCSDLISTIKHKKIVYSLLYWTYILTYTCGVLLFMLLLLRESEHHYGIHRTLVVILPVFFFCGLLIQIQYNLSVRVTWLCNAVDILMV